MCGLAGYYSTEKKFNRADLDLMTSCMQHRGPNADGYFEHQSVGFGHRRLSIIDLSSRANQPMTSLNGRYVIIFNGEVYNFTEIGARIKNITSQQHEVQFKTSSDTEIILEAFVHYGVDFVHQLNGMFVIVIYDKLLDELYVFRDRLGIKPLFYYWDGKNFLFASELKALQKINSIPKEINTDAVADFLHLSYIPTPNTIYKHIFKMQSGGWMKITHDGLEKGKYWNLKSKLHNNVIHDKEQALVKLSDLIMSSVQYQLKSDVPFGVFLSGGIDSSLVTAQAVGLSSVKVNTFSIGFEENTHNESEYAKAIARYLGTDHHEFIVSYKDAINLIDTALDMYDEPFGDSSSIPTMLVSKLAKQYVTVTLSGEGGDELFFGYGAYRWARRMNNPVLHAVRKPVSTLLSQLANRYQRVGMLLNYSEKDFLQSHIFSQEQYFFSRSELKNLLIDPYKSSATFEKGEMPKFLRAHDTPDPAEFLNVKERSLTPMESQALFDLEYYLQDDLLTKVDRASMHYSLETRVPYLDHRLVELALNVSPALKFKNGISKYILKEILYQYLPKKFFDRPKQGFAIPLNKWLSNELHYLIDDYLSEKVINQFKVVSYSFVKDILYRFENGSEYLFNRIWLLIVLHRWLKKHVN